MKIKKLSVKKLWDKYNFDIEFNEQVTILIGKNGSGKTTILNLLDELLSNGEKNNNYKFDKIKLQFNNDNLISAEQKEFNIIDEMKKNNNISKDKIKLLFKELEKDILKKIDNDKNSKYIPISLAKKIDSKSKIDYLFLSTFDMEIKNEELVHKHYDNSDIKTELDVLLNDLITKFKLYQLKLKEKVEKINQEFDTKLVEYARDENLNLLKDKLLEKNKNINIIYNNRDIFKNKINEFFKNTGKSIKLDENNSIIFKLDDKNSLTPYQLSSGEKQILIIMLSIMLLDNKPTIILMDEPEISLHVEWQMIFIKTLLELNSNLQIIIATHSPDIILKGYRKNVISLDNFKIKNS